MLISWTAADSSRRDRDYWQVLLIACVNHGEEFHQRASTQNAKSLNFQFGDLPAKSNLVST